MRKLGIECFIRDIQHATKYNQTLTDNKNRDTGIGTSN